jgi:hypothetical protein
LDDFRSTLNEHGRTNSHKPSRGALMAMQANQPSPLPRSAPELVVVLKPGSPAHEALVAPAPASTPDFTSREGYLGPAPIGVDAVFDIGGSRRRRPIIDCEWNWNLKHEDLRISKKGILVGTAGASFGFSRPLPNRLRSSMNCIGHSEHFRWRRDVKQNPL